MSAAALLRDEIVGVIEHLGFAAHGLHVTAGVETAQHRWTADVREDIHSAAKGMCVLAIGIAADEGKLDMDAPVATYLPDWRVGVGSDAVTLRHLLSMSSGIDFAWTPTMMSDWPDVAVEFLGRPSHGRRFQYSNASTYTAMRVLAARVGDPVDYLDGRLFDPLGIRDVFWERCPNGFVIGGGGLHLRTNELARIGRLIRDGGSWRGADLISSRWIDAMHADWVVAGTTDGYARYALAGWDGPGATWRLHGAHGQLVIFADDVVVTITGEDHARADALTKAIAELLADHAVGGAS